MKTISILVPRGAVALSCIEGSFTLFSSVNNILGERGQTELFRIQLVGLSSEPQVYHGRFDVRPDLTIHEAKKTDLIIIPAVNGDMDEVIRMNAPFFPWIQEQYHNGAEVASLCVGSFMLAATGLLKGKKCSTHWQAVSAFRKMFPDVNLVSEKIITDEQGIYSSGGALSFMNLLLYLVEKYAGRDMAVYVSKVYEIEIDRLTQSPFIIFGGQKDHDDEPVLRAQAFIEKHFHEKISVEQLASMLAISRRNLERRFKKATSNTAVEYMQRVKIEAAKQSLESSRENINEVMYKVGYTDTKAFRNAFKRITGLSPVEYRNRYNRQYLVAAS
ncbi:MAG TPA: helix-turn-helix domain-containing protein [Puia sp.]|nr:helix-turn-helix domain-containing protein [Puia sp.]